MLQTLCKFIIPIVQTLRGQAMMSADNIPLGPEAYEFVAELEKFVHALGIRSQQMTKVVEAKRRPLKDPVDYFEEIKWFWKLPEDSVTLHASTSIKYTLTRSSRLQDDLQKLHDNIIDSAPCCSNEWEKVSITILQDTQESRRGSRSHLPWRKQANETRMEMGARIIM
ncbi:hypothetical protein BDN70DRAFT_883663 [Pholiota conissans]|uniref:Uncharacterized protein n=1 Tax=Pholiota conissans TaxID=109636 RepID=A0A9P6CWQ2_9AGAR|nr:hypothetical protein BDN70DRAFT_883663 [Pholiota conissans]